MLYILVFIIVTYTLSHFIFKKNQTYLAVRKYIDWATIIVSTVLVITWIEIFHYSFLFFIYFLISGSIIFYLISRLRKIENKKMRAEEVIKDLKNEEKVLESEIQKISTNVK